MNSAPIELIEQRTANSKTFLMPDGRIGLEVSIGAVHYKDEQGKWQDIDETYSEPDTNGFSAKFTKCSHLTRIAEDGFRRIYPDRNDLSYWIDIGKPFASMGAPIKDRNKWTWGFPDASVSIEVQGSAIKFSAVLKNENAGTSMTIPFGVQGITRKGRFLYHDGQVVAELRKPFAIDAEGTERDLTVSFGSSKITLSLDTTGLIYPIEIDPSLDLQVAAGADDCHRVLLGTNALFSASSAVFRVGGTHATLGYALGNGARFTNVTIPQGTTITTAYLTVTARANKDGTVVNSKVSAEDVDNPGDFSGDDAASFDARYANHTTAIVDWNAIGAWTTDTEYNSPEIKTVIQERIDDALWTSGDAIVIFWEDFDDLSDDAKYRDGYSYEGSSAKAPKLHIEYEAVTEKSSSDSGAGVDAYVSLEKTEAKTSSDTGSGVESTPVQAAALVGNETGSGIEALVARLLAAFDTATGVEVSCLLKDLLVSELGQGSDSLIAKIEMPTKGGGMKLWT